MWVICSDTGSSNIFASLNTMGLPGLAYHLNELSVCLSTGAVNDGRCCCCCTTASLAGGVRLPRSAHSRSAHEGGAVTSHLAGTPSRTDAPWICCPTRCSAASRTSKGQHLPGQVYGPASYVNCYLLPSHVTGAVYNCMLSFSSRIAVPNVSDGALYLNMLPPDSRAAFIKQLVYRGVLPSRATWS